MQGTYKKLLENLGAKWNVRLNESEQVEIQAIDERLQRRAFTSQCLEDMYRRQLAEMRQQKVDAYRLQRELKVALDVALTSNNVQSEWDRAYGVARMTDEATILALKNHTRDIIVTRGYILTMLEYIPLAIAMIVAKSKNPNDRNVNQFWPYLLLMVSTMFLSIVIANLFSKRITSMLLPLTTNQVLDVAVGAGIELDTKFLDAIPMSGLTPAFSNQVQDNHDDLTSPPIDLESANNGPIDSGTRNPMCYS